MTAKTVSFSLDLFVEAFFFENHKISRFLQLLINFESQIQKSPYFLHYLQSFFSFSFEKNLILFHLKNPKISFDFFFISFVKISLFY